ncbi:SpoIID/LytB domain-containing protein [Caloramator sp. E03]|uniref:SpoIID/LytB domain-containing protein n=1 Tax=Caloramator sp. E03 TaxID=2576307 RepID=UPI00143CD620|nr:SpoIID/LytB domain-containing protein [Caloramator sp. E03]
MKRRILVFAVVFSFLFSSISFAFQRNSYFENLRIGLENMVSNSIEIILNGDYKVGDNIIQSGTSHFLNINNNKINMDGVDYDSILITPQNNTNTLTLKVGMKVYNYLGAFEFIVRSGSILPINIINVEDYLKGVVPYEMSNSFPIEALKAQSVAARNYALSNKGKHSDKGYDLCDTTDCQVYRGYNPSYSNVIKAVEDTKGMILLYNDEFVEGYYSASDGGYTEASINIWSANKDYLKTKLDEFDNELWPYGDVNLKSSDIDLKLKSKGYLKQEYNFVRIDLDSIKKYDSGRISSIEVVYKDINGVEQKLAFTKEKARTFLSLPSSLYDVTYDINTDTYTFKGKGNGHGVGMSQIGAKNRAIAGQTYDSILNFYYDGTYLLNMLNPSKELIINKDKININNNIFITYDGILEGALYKYVLEQDGNVVYVKDYSNDKNLMYVPDKAGNYRVHLYIKYSSSQNEFDEEKIKDFVVIDSNDSGIGNNSQSNSSSKEVNSNSGNDTIQQGNSSTQGTSSDNKTKTDSQNSSDINKSDNATNSITTVSALSISRSLSKGSKGNDVLLLQKYLKMLGYQLDENGVFDNKTNLAVVDFQKKNNINASGIVGVKTVAAINKAIMNKYTTSSVTVSRGESSIKNIRFSFQGVLKKGDKGEQVKKLQEALKFLSYNVDINGVFDEKTEVAVKAFQKSNKLVIDGIVGSKTIKLIEERLRLQ